MKQSIPPLTAPRQFELACLMNLTTQPTSTHTHLHFIPRTPGSIDYGKDFMMSHQKYTSLPNNKEERDKTVHYFACKLEKQFTDSSKLKVNWINTSQFCKNSEKKGMDDNQKKSKNPHWVHVAVKGLVAGIGLYVAYKLSTRPTHSYESSDNSPKPLNNIK